MNIRGIALAGRTKPPHSQAVMRRQKSKVSRHLVLQGFDLRRKKLQYFSASRADHMIVMLMIVMMLEISLVIAKSNHSGKAGLSQ